MLLIGAKKMRSLNEKITKKLSNLQFKLLYVNMSVSLKNI